MLEVERELDDVGGAKPQDSMWVEDKPQKSQIASILVMKQWSGLRGYRATAVVNFPNELMKCAANTEQSRTGRWYECSEVNCVVGEALV